MSIFSKLCSLSLLVVLSMGLPSLTWAMAPVAGTPDEARALYDRVWLLLDNKFVDDSKNHQAWGLWRHRYDDKLSNPNDAFVAIDTMIQSLGDRYTRFLPPEEFKEETDSIKATLCGIGVQIGERDGRLVVIAPIEDTPAAKAGMKANDVILKIDGKSTQGMTVKSGADLIKGDKGSTVTILLKRGETEHTLVIERAEIKLKSVSVKPPFELTVPEPVTYIKLSSFLSKTAGQEVEDAVKKALSDKKQGLVLDLRSNPGGLLENAISIASLFLEDATVVSTVDRAGYKSVRSTQGQPIWQKPLVILIDEGSASASEILAGALKDHERATLVGKRSFGKGLVQEINPLPTGAGVNVTTQKYLTPNDTDINKKGIDPHVEVKLTEEDAKAKKDPQLQEALNILKTKYGVLL